MRRSRSFLLSVWLLFGLAAAAMAADNSTLPVSGGGTEVFANKDIGGVKFPKSINYDSAGAEIFVSGNAGYVRFPSAQAVTISSGTVTTLTTLTGGGVASGAADSGNPLKVGGKYNAVPPALTDGNRGDLQLSSSGGVRSMPGANWAAATTWTTATSLNTNSMLMCGDGAPALIADLVGSGTISAGVVTFQYSNDNTDCNPANGTWVNLPISNVISQFPLASLTNPYTVTTGQTAFLVLPNGARAVKAKLTTALTGSGAQVIVTPTVGSVNPAVLALTFPLAAGAAEIGGVNITKWGGTAAVNGGTAGIVGIGGSTATNVALTDNPLNNGGQAVSSENAAVTTGRKVQFVADLVGKQIVMPYANPENFVSGAISSAMTGTTSTSLVASPGGSLRNYITQITCSNAHATQGTDIIIQDGSGGTTIYLLPAAAVYGGAVINFPTPLRQPTVATALFAANVTTGASTKCAASGYKGL